MKWFGVDYRYVIAGVGAVFILAYEPKSRLKVTSEFYGLTFS